MELAGRQPCDRSLPAFPDGDPSAPVLYTCVHPATCCTCVWCYRVFGRTHVRDIHRAVVFRLALGLLLGPMRTTLSEGASGQSVRSARFVPPQVLRTQDSSRTTSHLHPQLAPQCPRRTSRLTSRPPRWVDPHSTPRRTSPSQHLPADSGYPLLLTRLDLRSDSMTSDTAISPYSLSKVPTLRSSQPDLDTPASRQSSTSMDSCLRVSTETPPTPSTHLGEILMCTGCARETPERRNAERGLT